MLRFPLGKKRLHFINWNGDETVNICIFPFQKFVKWILKFMYLHFIFSIPNFTYQEVQNPPDRNFSGHTGSNLALMYL